jgi:hypothetical protein
MHNFGILNVSAYALCARGMQITRAAACEGAKAQAASWRVKGLDG